MYDDFRFEPIKENKEDADDDVRNRLYFGVQCGHPYGSDYMYEIFTGRYGYDIEFKCKNKRYMNYNDMYNDELMSETVDGYLQTLGEKGV